jgi:hypothetical protein
MKRDGSYLEVIIPCGQLNSLVLPHIRRLFLLFVHTYTAPVLQLVSSIPAFFLLTGSIIPVM